MSCRVELWPASWLPPTADLLSGAAYAGLFLLTFLLAELGKQRHSLPVEVTRKFVHLGAGVLVAVLPCFFTSIATVALLSLSFFGILLGSRLLGLLPSVHGVERRSAGAFAYPLSVLGVLVLSGGGGILFSIPVLVLAFSDALAAVVGKAYGRVHFRIYDQTRSLEGSAVFLITTFLVIHVPLSLSGRVGPAESLLIALLLAFLVTCFEAIAVGGWDNVLIPIATLFALERMLPLPVGTLIGRALFVLGIVFVGVFTFRRQRLTVASLFGSFLLAYGALALGGLPWLVPLLVLYFTYSVGVPLERDPAPRRLSYREGGDDDLIDIRRMFYLLLVSTSVLLLYSALPHPALFGVFVAVLAFVFAIPYGLYGDLRARLGSPEDEGRGTRFVFGARILFWGLAGVVACTLVAWAMPGSPLQASPLALMLAPVSAATGFVTFLATGRWLLPTFHCSVCGKHTTHPWCHREPAALVREGRMRLDFSRAFFVFAFGVALLFLCLFGLLQLAKATLAGAPS